MTTGSQLHGARWPRFNCVQMIETMSWAAAVAKKDDNEHSLLMYRDHSNREESLCC